MQNLINYLEEAKCYCLLAGNCKDAKLEDEQLLRAFAYDINVMLEQYKREILYKEGEN